MEKNKVSPISSQENVYPNKRFDELPSHVQKYLIAVVRAYLDLDPPDESEIEENGEIEEDEEIARQAQAAWEWLDAHSREELIHQLDLYEDSQFAEMRAYFWDLRAKISDTRMKIREAEALVTHGLPSEEQLKQHQISALKNELSQLEQSWASDYQGSSLASSLTSPAPDTSPAEGFKKVSCLAGFIVRKLKTRIRILDAEIAEAKKAVAKHGLDPEEVQCVWTALVKLAEAEFGCLLGVTDREIKYQDGDEVKFFKKSDLRKRIDRQKDKTRQSPITPDNAR